MGELTSHDTGNAGVVRYAAVHAAASRSDALLCTLGSLLMRRSRQVLAKGVSAATLRLELARAGRKLGHPTEEERRATQALRAGVSSLPPLPAGRSGPERQWLRNRADLRHSIANEDPRAFLRWPVIANAMVVPSTAEYVLDIELPAVRQAGLLPLLNEDRNGFPSIIDGTATSGNLVHHAYHLLRFAQATGRAVDTFTDVVELGAGYGSMARLVYRLTAGRTRLWLCDLPEFSALQRYYLGGLGIPAKTFEAPADLENPASARRLLIATWSLSEIDVVDRDRLLEGLGMFDGYLLAYQDSFRGSDNVAYFDDLVTRTAQDVDWLLHEPIRHIPGNRYLFGCRRGS